MTRKPKQPASGLLIENLIVTSESEDSVSVEEAVMLRLDGDAHDMGSIEVLRAEVTNLKKVVAALADALVNGRSLTDHDIINKLTHSQISE